MTKKILLMLPALLLSALCLRAQEHPELQKLEQVIDIISKSYMDTINIRKLVDETIKILFERLDPHSVYRSKNEAKDDFLNRPSSYRGIGIDFRMFDDTMTVTSVTKNSPAEKAGLRPGSKIAFVNGKNFSGNKIKYNDVNDYMTKLYMGEDSIKLGVIKDRKIKIAAVLPSEIPNISLESFYAINDSCIYVRISHFTFDTGKEFTEALKSFSKRQRKNLILDLRDNPGGILAGCNEVCNHIFDTDIQIANMRGNSEVSCKSLFSNGEGLLINSRVCVIINELSASASEVLAGAVQDWDRGIVVGRRSFGKGLVQQLFTLCDSSQIRITVSKIHTPSGRYIQKEYKSGEFNKYNGELPSRRLRGENTDKNKIPISDSPEIFYSIRSLRKIYPGLGIIPDAFVAEDTSEVLPQFWQSWYTNKAVDNFILEDINKNRQKYTKYFGTFQKFADEFCPTRKQERKIYEYCQKDTSNCQKISRQEFEASISDSEPESQEKAVLKLLKARYAYFLFGSNECRKILNDGDRDFNEALRLINNYEEYEKMLKY